MFHVKQKGGLYMNDYDYNKMLKKVNMRLRRMRDKGIKTPAYESAMDYIYHNQGSNDEFFRKTKDDFERARQIDYLTKFLNFKTSSISGYKLNKRVHEQYFMEKGYKGKNMEQLYEFLNSAEFATLSSIYDSNQIVDEISNLSDAGYTMDEIKKLFKKNLAKNIQKKDYERMVKNARNKGINI